MNNPLNNPKLDETTKQLVKEILKKEKNNSFKTRGLADDIKLIIEKHIK
jgi:hypothetical protein